MGDLHFVVIYHNSQVISGHPVCFEQDFVIHLIGIEYNFTPDHVMQGYFSGDWHLDPNNIGCSLIDQLSDFSAKGAKQVEAKAEGLLGDAYAELKKNDDAIAHYKNAGTIFEEDQAISSEYLFRGALLSEMSGKTDQAIELYQILKNKYPRTDKGFVVDKYLARLGVVK